MKEKIKRLNGQKAAAGCNLYIQRIPLKWDEIELARHFDHFGDILSCTVERDENGDSRGFGYVGFKEVTAVRKAIIGMDGFPVGPPLELPGKFLSVMPLKGEEHLLIPFPDCYPAPGKYGSEPNGRAFPGGNISIDGIPPNWVDMDLYRHFIHYGVIVSLAVMMKDGNKENRGFGFVGYGEPLSGQRAIAGMNNFLLDPESGRRLRVKIKRGEEAAGEQWRKEIAKKDPHHPDFQDDGREMEATINSKTGFAWMDS